MRKTSETIGGAVTILNATVTGIGAAMGILEFSKINIEENKGIMFDIFPPISDGRLLEACLSVFAERTGIVPNDIKITTESPFPPEKGLKTSSAISTGAIKALADYYEVEIPIEKLLEYSAEASINAGVSLTGAYDDAAACYFGGVAYTDNNKKEILSLMNSPKGFDIILLVPPESLPKNKVNVEKVDKVLVKEAMEAFEKRKLFEAIYYNTLAFGQVLLPNFEHVERLEALGAEIVGLNGTGPSLFAFIQPSKSEQFIELVEATGHYTTIKTKPRPLTKKGLEVYYNVDNP
ncbi:MAG: shikimate kinase [Methanobacteriota archaeon]|nr:MAG: shikimate kinase [Euryarchaeota archaeon]